MTASKLRLLATALALPAPLCAAVVPLANLWDQALRSQMRAGASPPSLVMLLLFSLYGLVPCVLLIGAIHRPDGHGRGWAIGASTFTVTALLLMAWTAVRLITGYADMGLGDALGYWVVGPSLAMYGPHVGSGLLAAAIALRHRGAITAVAFGGQLPTLVGLSATAMLTKLTWGTYWTWSGREMAWAAHAFFLPELVLAALLIAWKRPPEGDGAS